MVQKGAMNLAWDARDRLVELSGSQSASFAYDALGRRIEKTISGVTTQYLYDGLDIVKEMDGTGATKAWYVRTVNIDEPLARIEDDGTVRYYHVDALGSIIALTDGSGMVKTQYNYSPYGETQVIGEASDNPFQYTARENDGTGLYAYRLRYYSPEMRSFISEDPIRFAGGMNWYSYVGNRPVNAVDPLGLEVWEPDQFTRTNLSIYFDAEHRAEEKYGRNPSWPRDAYRHCLASCMIAFENGPGDAVVLGHLNELKGDWGQNQECGEKQMDYYNNAKGREFAEQASDVRDCETICYQAEQTGQLINHYRKGSTPKFIEVYWP
jgi:RHS repeat-associated protein